MCRVPTGPTRLSTPSPNPTLFGSDPGAEVPVGAVARDVAEQVMLDRGLEAVDRAARDGRRQGREATPQTRAALAAERGDEAGGIPPVRSEEHTSELQSLMRISYAVLCLEKKRK